ncbi:hypothetical protein [Aedoeadaptatus pacaensis]|uniref:hypothetical protein n=1 Tax=Aedoeadaptatus pacaensis TaxID=1776390 RepID=UPI0008381A49|nr:hypothetical protein [Peptoniphilus pacaensis]
MNGLLTLILIGAFGLIRSRMEQRRRAEANQKKNHKEREPDYKTLPFEVQQAIKEFQQPGEKPAKKKTQRQIDRHLKQKRQMSDEALQRATEAEKAMTSTEEQAKAEPADEKPSPFAAIEAFDEAYRPFIYSEVFSKPKCKRK